jgi:hypothetical protein
MDHQLGPGYRGEWLGRDALAAQPIELRLASVRKVPAERLRRIGLAERVEIEPTLDTAVRSD